MLVSDQLRHSCIDIVMLKTARVADSASAQQLIKLWSQRYLPDLSNLPPQKYSFPAIDLIEHASRQGRARTVNRLRSLLSIQCELAGLEATALFTYIPNIVTLAEARRISPYVKRVYEKVFEIYQQQEPPNSYLRYIDASSQLFSKIALPSLMLPAMHQLADALEPVLLELQKTYLTAQDRRTIGFLTTQFHFTTKNILQKISPCEQVLIAPYLNFVEEQICIPWQRLCAVRSPNPDKLRVVTQLLPKSHEIAHRVLAQAIRQHPKHSSRRGTLMQSMVRSSTLRDLHMVQGYLYLCVLEDSMSAIEQELLPLCLIVFPNIEVAWELVESMLRSLEQELFAQLDPTQVWLLSPYTGAMRELFADAATAEVEETISPLKLKVY